MKHMVEYRKHQGALSQHGEELHATSFRVEQTLARLWLNLNRDEDLDENIDRIKKEAEVLKAKADTIVAYAESLAKEAKDNA